MAFRLPSIISQSTQDNMDATSFQQSLQDSLASLNFQAALPAALDGLKQAAQWTPAPIMVSDRPNALRIAQQQQTAPGMPQVMPSTLDTAPPTPSTPLTPGMAQNSSPGITVGQGGSARPVAAGGTPQPMPTGANASGGTDHGSIDNSSRSAFVQSAWPYMLEAADGDARLAESLLAIAINENGDVGKGGGFIGNNFFGIKGRGSAGSFESSTWEEENGQRVPQRAVFAAYNSPQEGFRQFGQFLRDNPRYHDALARYQQSGDVDQLLRDVNGAGYATDSQWAGKIANIRDTQVSPLTRGLSAAPSRRTPDAAPPDAPARIEPLVTPNLGGPRKTTRGIVVHSTRGPGATPEEEYQKTLEWFGNPTSEVSAHAVIAADGTIAQIGDWDAQAWHAGENNADRIGIELVQSAADNDRGVPFTDAQYRSLAWLTSHLSKRYGFAIDRNALVGHEELAQGHRNGKTDPGKSFDWNRYQQEAKQYSATPSPAAGRAPNAGPIPASPPGPPAGAAASPAQPPAGGSPYDGAAQGAGDTNYALDLNQPQDTPPPPSEWTPPDNIDPSTGQPIGQQTGPNDLVYPYNRPGLQWREGQPVPIPNAVPAQDWTNGGDQNGKMLRAPGMLGGDPVQRYQALDMSQPQDQPGDGSGYERPSDPMGVRSTYNDPDAMDRATSAALPPVYTDSAPRAGGAPGLRIPSSPPVSDDPAMSYTGGALRAAGGAPGVPVPLSSPAYNDPGGARFAAEDSQSTPPPPGVSPYDETPPRVPPAPTPFKPLYDAAGNVVGYVQGAADAAYRGLEPVRQAAQALDASTQFDQSQQGADPTSPDYVPPSSPFTRAINAPITAPQVAASHAGDLTRPVMPAEMTMEQRERVRRGGELTDEEHAAIVARRQEPHSLDLENEIRAAPYQIADATRRTIVDAAESFASAIRAGRDGRPLAAAANALWGAVQVLPPMARYTAMAHAVDEALPEANIAGMGPGALVGSRELIGDALKGVNKLRGLLTPEGMAAVATVPERGLQGAANAIDAAIPVVQQAASAVGRGARALAEEGAGRLMDLTPQPSMMPRGTGGLVPEPPAENAPTFYSHLRRVIDERMPNRASSGQVEGIIKSGQVKPDEVAWTGLDDWLKKPVDAEGQRIVGPVTKKQVLEYLDRNAVKVEEVVKGRGVADVKLMEEQLQVAQHALTEATRQSGGIQPGDRVATVGSGPSRGGYSYSTGKVYEATRTPQGDLVWRAAETFGGTRAGRSQRFVNELKQQATDMGIPWDDAVRHNDVVRQSAPVDPSLQADIARLRSEIDSAKQAGQPKFDHYTLPGGKRYRELLLTRPAGKVQPLTAAERVEFDRLDRLHGADRLDVADASRYDDLWRRANGEVNAANRGETYTSTHWDEPNVLAHVRFNDRTAPDGKKVLFIEEIQSDWHQAGRKHGYARPLTAEEATTVADLKAQRRQVGQRVQALVDQRSEARMNGDRGTLQRVNTEYADATATVARLEAEIRSATDVQSGVPNAPFEKTWSELSTKRIIRWAAENGYDRVAWTPGSVQTGRWGTERLSWVKQPDGSFQVHVEPQVGGHAAGVDIQAEATARGLISRGTPQRVTSLDDMKALLDRTSGIEAPGAREVAENRTLADQTWKRMQAEPEGVYMPRDAGMKGFYDQILPNVAQKIGKRFGARVGQGEIATFGLPDSFRVQNTADEGWSLIDDATGKVLEGGFPTREAAWAAGDRYAPTQPVHSMDITPAMRESVTTEGQPLFAGLPFDPASAALGAGAGAASPDEEGNQADPLRTGLGLVAGGILKRRGHISPVGGINPRVLAKGIQRAAAKGAGAANQVPGLPMLAPNASPSAWQWAQTWRYGVGLFGQLSTAMMQLGGGLGEVATGIPTEALRQGVIRGHPEHLPLIAWEGLKSLPAGVAEGAKAVAGKVPQTILNSSDYRPPMSAHLSGPAKAAAFVMETPGRVATQAPDAMWYEVFYRTGLAQAAAEEAQKAGAPRLNPARSVSMQRQLIANPTPEMIDRAHRLAQDATYKGDLGALGQIGEMVVKGPPAQMLSGLPPEAQRVFSVYREIASHFMPVYHTIARITEGGAGYVPGLGALPLEKVGLAAKGMKVDEKVAQQATGLMLTMGLLGYAASGGVRGPGHPDPDVNQEMRDQGRENNTTNLGGIWVQNSALGRPGVMLNMVGALNDAMVYGDGKDSWKDISEADPYFRRRVSLLVNNLGKAWSDYPTASAFSTLTKMFKDPEAGLAELAGNTASQYVPGVVKTIATATDTKVRRPDRDPNGSPLDVAADTFAQRSGVGRTGLPPAQDRLGREVENQRQGWAALFPRVGRDRPDLIIQAFIDNKVEIPQKRTEITVDGLPIKLTPPLQRRWQQYMGEYLLKETPKTLRSQFWSRPTTTIGDRGDELRDLSKEAADDATDRIQDDIGSQQLNQMLKDAERAKAKQRGELVPAGR